MKHRSSSRAAKLSPRRCCSNSSRSHLDFSNRGTELADQSLRRRLLETPYPARLPPRSSSRPRTPPHHATMKLGVVGGSSLVSFDPIDEFAAIGLTISSKKDITVETAARQGAAADRRADGRGVAHDRLRAAPQPRQRRHDAAARDQLHHAEHAAARRPGRRRDRRDDVGRHDPRDVEALPPGRVGVCRQYIDFTGVATTYHHDDAKPTSVHALRRSTSGSTRSSARDASAACRASAPTRGSSTRRS